MWPAGPSVVGMTLRGLIHVSQQAATVCVGRAIWHRRGHVVAAHRLRAAVGAAAGGQTQHQRGGDGSQGGGAKSQG